MQDLDNETLLHMDAESQRKALEDELEFLKQLHEQVKPITFANFVLCLARDVLEYS